jgi:hypothetical protein
MSPFFVKYFRSQNPCPHCRVGVTTEKAPGKSLCGVHLRLARLVWRLWAIARRGLGKCIECRAKTVENNCRCKKHRRANILKGRAYYATHKDQMNSREQEWREKLISQGLCPNCPQHHALEPGYRRCADCRAIHQAYKADSPEAIAVLVAQRQEKRAFREQRHAELRTKLAADLAAMGYEFSMNRKGGKSCRRIEQQA